MIVAVPAALVAALAFALSTTLHQRAAKQQPRRQALDVRLLRTRLWQLGRVPDVAATLVGTAGLVTFLAVTAIPGPA